MAMLNNQRVIAMCGHVRPCVAGRFASNSQVIGHKPCAQILSPKSHIKSWLDWLLAQMDPNWWTSLYLFSFGWDYDLSLSIYISNWLPSSKLTSIFKTSPPLVESPPPNSEARSRTAIHRLCTPRGPGTCSESSEGRRRSSARNDTETRSASGSAGAAPRAEEAQTRGGTKWWPPRVWQVVGHNPICLPEIDRSLFLAFLLWLCFP